jgi:hypothetical protein
MPITIVRLAIIIESSEQQPEATDSDWIQVHIFYIFRSAISPLGAANTCAALDLHWTS